MVVDIGDVNVVTRSSGADTRRSFTGLLAWTSFGLGVLCLVFGEGLLVDADHAFFGELSTRWWLAIASLVLTILQPVVTGVVCFRAVQAFRRATSATFAKLALLSLLIGAVEVVLSTYIAGLILIVF